MREQLKKATFALIGTAEFAVEKGRELAKAAGSRARDGRKDLESFYRDASKRGERLVTRVRRSRAADRAAAGAKPEAKDVKKAS